MNKLKTCGLIFSLCFLAVGMGPVFAKPSSNFLAKAELNRNQIQQLKSLGIKVFIPTYIPAGFKVAKMEVKPCPSGTQRSATGVCRFGPQYGIVYQNSNNTCFAIEATGGGVGGVPELVNQVKLNMGDLGESTLYYGQYEMPEMRRNSSESLLYMDWAGRGPFYRLIGAGLVRKAYYGERQNQRVSECRNEISSEEAVKIIESFSSL